MPNEADTAEQVRKLLQSYGRTYAQEAGIRLAAALVRLSLTRKPLLDKAAAES